ncbi:MAG: hypothetical protein ABIN36_15275 [Ferruginibacter sp.]
MDKQTDEILSLLQKCSQHQREFIFKHLRKEIKIHDIEIKLNVAAEIILEAINKDAAGLTFRMMRGVIAEAAFEIEVLKNLKDWENITPFGDLPFDFLVRDNVGTISIQVKLQRSVNQKPMMANQAVKKFSKNLFVVETQKTRGGIDHETGEDTRPYRFGEFNILAVAMHPSSGHWSDFMYTVSDWLIPSGEGSNRILKFQPVSPTSNVDWTNSFETAIEWYRNQIKKTIAAL